MIPVNHAEESRIVDASSLLSQDRLDKLLLSGDLILADRSVYYTSEY